MSAPASPKPSFESEDRPGSCETTTQVPGSNHLPSVAFEDNLASGPRRKSIQFQVGSEAKLPTRSVSFKDKRRSHVDASTKDLEVEKEQRPLSTVRGPSPPPPKTFERGVSFNTFDNRDAADFTLTLNYKHKGYQSTRRSRTFLCGTDTNDYSDFALEWLVDGIVDDGDEIVCLRAVEKDSRMASDTSIEEGKYRKEAEKLFEQVIQMNSQNDKSISLVVEMVVGKVEDIIQRMIRIYEPAMLIVGTRGRNLKGVHSLLPGSVSKYCLQQSPIPVVVVRPTPKREKKKKKRRADPTRKSYNHILEMSDRRGGRIFNPSSSTESSTSMLPDEEAAVARALGLPATYSNNHSRSSLSISDRSSIGAGDGENLQSLDTVLMKSPQAESPASSVESVDSTAVPKRAPSPFPHDETSSVVDDHDPDDENPSSNQIEDTTEESAASTPVEDAEDKTPEASPSLPIPVIEVSNDNEPKPKADDSHDNEKTQDRGETGPEED
ncbi:hypothetical protein N7468_005325 [Penicillium chermesinum]|uniref:UspA domain-containing protein n=1 Tax=Penicillium chermesinum TaxID=63820 RepID=A0A9W9NYW1_9EURO|nr:uncharacterized protein N7468_005325 [Penicillium chermesinum]KAJ5232369.1 hypothetical protein N7468_005325 [Penicillium chermesinum]KAJ6172028.1 hypothetical protein N7470_001095 [Penicillium chermesinum]